MACPRALPPPSHRLQQPHQRLAPPSTIGYHPLTKTMTLTFERYAELLSKIIWGTITPAEQKAVAAFEAAAPELCPACKHKMRSIAPPHRICHNAEECALRRSAL